MRHARLDLVVCQHCHAALTSFTAVERQSVARPGLMPATARAAADPTSTVIVEIKKWLLSCAGWYPIIGQLPEILPDHPRDPARTARRRPGIGG